MKQKLTTLFAIWAKFALSLQNAHCIGHSTVHRALFVCSLLTELRLHGYKFDLFVLLCFALLTCIVCAHNSIELHREDETIKLHSVNAYTFIAFNFLNKCLSNRLHHNTNWIDLKCRLKSWNSNWIARQFSFMENNINNNQIYMNNVKIFLPIDSYEKCLCLGPKRENNEKSNPISKHKNEKKEQNSLIANQAKRRFITFKWCVNS